MRIFRGYARKTRGATGDNTGVYRPSEPQADEAEGGKDHPESGDDGWEAPPVPIPNTAVKLPRVESTGLEAAWEDRLLPVTSKPPH